MLLSFEKMLKFILCLELTQTKTEKFPEALTVISISDDHFQRLSLGVSDYITHRQLPGSYQS